MKTIRAGYGVITVMLAAVLMTMRSAPAQDNATEPHLRFKKEIIVKPYRDGRVFTEPYTVKQGEYLWRILRDHYRMSNAKIAFYCAMTRAVNPEVQDMNMLHKDQNILVPYDYDKGTEPLPTEKPSKKDIVHVVVRGEHLGRILREKCGLSEQNVFSRHTRDVIAAANPHLSDTDMLEEGQRILIPSTLCTGDDSLASAAGKRSLAPAATDNRTLHAAEQQQESSRTTRPDTPSLLPLHGVAAPGSAPAVSADEARVQNMLSAFARSFGGTDNRTGEKLFPVGRGGLSLDYSTFPVLTFPWGRKVVFDYGSTLPAALKEVISSEWDNAEVVSVRSRDDMETVLGKVLDGSGFYRVEKGGEYAVSRNNIQVSVSGNWIVFKDPLMRNVFIVNLVQGDDQSLPEGLKRYFADTGLNIVDIHQDGPAAAGKHSGGYAAERGVLQIQSAPAVITDIILDCIGQPYQKDYSTKIFQNMYSGFSLEVIADRMFEKDYETHLIDFQNLPGRIAGIIAEQGFHLLQINPQENDLDHVIHKVLTFCGAPFKPTPLKFTYDHGEKTNVKLTIPGFLIETKTGDLLLTNANLGESIVQFLAEIDIKIIKY